MSLPDRAQRHLVRLTRAAVAAAMLSAAALGCVSLKPVLLDRKTQLENQVLGSFQRLEQDLILASSVRGERPAPKLTPLQREAVEAMMSRAFNKDDVDALKQEQVVGEANTGMLSIRTQPKDPVLVKRVAALVQQENRDRLVIIKRVIQLDPQLGDKDLPEVRRIFYRLNLQTAQPGDLVQREAGDWETARKRGGGAK
jgi:hypothetical protein